MHCCSSP